MNKIKLLELDYIYLINNFLFFFFVKKLKIQFSLKLIINKKRKIIFK
jgi:hypothetical protein